MRHKISNFKYGGLTLPMNMKNAIDRYVLHGTNPGNFLTDCLANDLHGACHSGDLWEITLLPVITTYIYNKTPADCWQSHEAVKNWKGKMNEEAA